MVHTSGIVPIATCGVAQQPEIATLGYPASKNRISFDIPLQQTGLRMSLALLIAEYRHNEMLCLSARQAKLGSDGRPNLDFTATCRRSHVQRGAVGGHVRLERDHRAVRPTPRTGYANRGQGLRTSSGDTAVIPG